MIYKAYQWTFRRFPAFRFTRNLDEHHHTEFLVHFLANKSKGWVPINGITGSKSHMHFKFCQLFPNYPAKSLHQFPLSQTVGDSVHFPTISWTLDVIKLFHLCQSDEWNQWCPHFCLDFSIISEVVFPTFISYLYFLFCKLAVFTLSSVSVGLVYLFLTDIWVFWKLRKIALFQMFCKYFPICLLSFLMELCALQNIICFTYSNWSFLFL